ncbi:cupredoxin domain-containing protein [Fulvivirgaceae bacterium BMA12]|uniref:Cupredoxin domain-containing protein n=1 Tax=Agaribacillus aureus TaxID=3051825 RepID=A0ABT8L8D2_9BACT|nr:cupredoxin domain-containing protein [Fulvivirgaceae bacterium BMA12]
MQKIKILGVVAALMISFATLAQDKVETVKLEQTTGEFTTKTLKVKPGTYVFEVSNSNVDHEVGFVLAPKKANIEAKDHIQKAYLSKTINTGETASSQEVTLEKGEYVYFCPLNPTPQYTLIVE